VNRPVLAAAGIAGLVGLGMVALRGADVPLGVPLVLVGAPVLVVVLGLWFESPGAVAAGLVAVAALVAVQLAGRSVTAGGAAAWATALAVVVETVLRAGGPPSPHAADWPARVRAATPWLAALVAPSLTGLLVVGLFRLERPGHAWVLSGLAVLAVAVTFALALLVRAGSDGGGRGYGHE
jgi:hypothetical protein